MSKDIIERLKAAEIALQKDRPYAAAAIRDGLALLENQQQFKRAMTVAEFLAAYSVGRTALYEEIKAGRLRARKMGSKTLILVEDAETWFANLALLSNSGSQP